MAKGLLFIISGPSGVGKGTLRQEVLKQAGIDLTYSVSMTTRQIRPGEMEGREYYFVSEEEFQKNVDRGNFLEYNSFVGHRYGTPRDKVEELLSQGKSVLLEIDVNGARQILSKKKDGVVSFFILPPSIEELERRIRKRSTEEEKDISGRLAESIGEMAHQGEYTYRILNDDVERAGAEIASLIRLSVSERND